IGVIAEKFSDYGNYMDEYDKKNDDDILYHLGSRTPYRFNANMDITDAKKRTCPTKIWMFIRHGTNYPSKNEINNMNNRLSLIQELVLDAHEDDSDALGTLRDEELEVFDEWVPMIEDITKEKHLTAEGERENIGLAQRMQKRYPTIFKPKFSNQTYKFRYTNSQRALRSAQAFAEGLFNNSKNVHLPPPNEKEMEILQFYSKCTKWRNEVDDNLNSLKERNLFENSEIVKEAVEDININLGLKEDELSLDDIMLMYKACGFETAWNDSLISPWCLPFDLDTIKVFEYIGDLRQYWFSGYGYKINYQQACPAFNDMIKFFENKNTPRTATLYFTHSGALLKLLTLLGLDHDKEHLLHSNYMSNSERKYRTSAFDNFASNIAFILHGCKSKQKVTVRQNEYIIRLPACPKTDSCDLSIIK
ncbi:Phosphatase, partial [Oryctes borbonicus]